MALVGWLRGRQFFRTHKHTPTKRLQKPTQQVQDIKELGLPGFIEKYNGKPTLITKSGTLTRVSKEVQN